MKGRRFHVTLVPKEGHPWQHRNTGKYAFAVNGKKGAVLHMNRGSTYFFTVKQYDSANCEGGMTGRREIHPFYFTRDLVGGEGGVWADSSTYIPAKIPGFPDPIVEGTVKVEIDDCTPNYFFFQSAAGTAMGGLCIVHDQ